MNPTVQIRVDFGGSDKIPHTFLEVTNPDGSKVEYGLVPEQQGSPSGKGKIDETGPGVGKDPHEYDVATPPMDLTPKQYDDLIKEINDSKNSPPDYILPGSWWPNNQGTNCTGWAA